MATRKRAWPEGVVCKSCNTRKYEYHGNGLCTACHARLWRKKHPAKVKVQNKRSYVRNYILRNDEVLARRRKRYATDPTLRLKQRLRAHKQYLKDPAAYRARCYERRKRTDRNAFEKIKPRVLKRDKYTCQKPGCGRTKGRLHVHHINGIGSDHRMENLITWCDRCHRSHREHHEHKRKYGRA